MADDSRTIGSIQFPASVLTYLSPADPALAIERATRHVDLWAYELSTVSAWLPTPCETVIDIGCGLGGIDLALARAGHGRNFVLIDGAGNLEHKQHGYQETTQAWADVCQAKTLMETNVPDAGCIAFHADRINMQSWPCDLVLSFKSCGFHYQVAAYLDFIVESLRPGGRLIIDCRRGSDNQQAILDRGFGKIGLVESNGKRDRWVFVKP